MPDNNNRIELPICVDLPENSEKKAEIEHFLNILCLNPTKAEQDDKDK